MLLVTYPLLVARYVTPIPGVYHEGNHGSCQGVCNKKHAAEYATRSISLGGAMEYATVMGPRSMSQSMPLRRGQEGATRSEP